MITSKSYWSSAEHVILTCCCMDILHLHVLWENNSWSGIVIAVSQIIRAALSQYAHFVAVNLYMVTASFWKSLLGRTWISTENWCMTRNSSCCRSRQRSSLGLYMLPKIHDDIKCKQYFCAEILHVLNEPSIHSFDLSSLSLNTCIRFIGSLEHFPIHS